MGLDEVQQTVRHEHRLTKSRLRAIRTDATTKNEIAELFDGIA